MNKQQIKQDTFSRCVILALLAIQYWAMGSIFAQETDFLCKEPLVDERDGKTYTTVLIGDQCWMSENLNYGTFEEVRGNEGNPGRKHCYKNNPSNCEKYGALYTWEEANGAEVCPSGWHIPGKGEWLKLAKLLGDKESGQKIKASPTDPIPWDGTNETGLSIIPSGAGNGSDFHRLGQWALFWTSDSNGKLRAWFAQLDGFWYPQPPKYKKIIVDSYYLKTNTLSVRCIKDSD